MKNRIFRLFKPCVILNALVCRMSWLFTDEHLVKLVFRFNMHQWPNLKSPKSFNEKLAWLKVYYRNPLYYTLVDKYRVKEYVSNIIGGDYIIPTIGVWDNIDDIDFSTLPQSFVLKTTHDGGSWGVVICKDKSNFNINEAKRKLRKSVNNKTYQGEWPYKGVKPRIIAEKYMEDEKTNELRDYKFFCFNGKVKALFVASERQTRNEPYFDFFDSNFNHLPFTQGHPNNPNKIVKPDKFDEMKEIAEKLTKNIPCVRCDLYEVNGKVYFGEFTFFHFGGIVPFNPVSIDYEWGNWIELPEKNFN